MSDADTTTPAKKPADAPAKKPAETAKPAAKKPAPKPPVKAPAKAAAKPGPKVVIRPVADSAQAKKRHWGLGLAFAVMVALPLAVTTLYLTTRAANQYGSYLGFTVRSEEGASASDVLSGFAGSLGVSGNGTRDSDILYNFIRSQEIVSAIDARLDLRSIYAKYRNTDPVFSFHPDGRFFGVKQQGTIEDLTDYWQRMVRISYDQTSGLMDVTALAFSPEDAQAISTAIYDESLSRINALSADARDDATQYATQDLDLAVERLKTAREALTAFRVANEIVDVTADIQGQMGLLSALQVQLAEALIDLDLLQGNARDGDARLGQAQARINAIEAQIENERRKLGSGGSGDESYANTVADFERLTVDREIAELSYVASVAAYDSAIADANRQSLYLAAYIRPTLAEKSEYPQHSVIIALVGLFSFLTWTIGALVFYALRDRR